MARLTFFCVTAVFFFSSFAFGATTITLRFRGPQGEPVRLTRAEILISGWGYGDEKPIPASGDTIRLTLDPGAALQDGFKLAAAESSFLYVEAAGYAGWRSDAFDWPTGAQFKPIRLVLADGQSLVITSDADATAVVTLRKATPRRITLLDEQGTPVAATRLVVSMFWSDANHCGRFSGARALVSSLTDTTGTIVVPDIDSEYGLQLGGDHMKFVRNENWPEQAIVRLNSTDTVVQVHRYKQTPLHVRVVNRGVPVKGASFMVDLQLGTCGAGSGQAAVSDADGVISVPDFYTEEWPFVTICYANKEWWAGAPSEGVPQTLDIATATSKSSYLCEP